MAELHYTFPVRECWGLGTKYGWTKRDGEDYFHGGIDISYYDNPNTDLLAVKSGKIVASYDVGKDGYYGGNIIALEVPYGNQKQWIVYQHCKNTVALRDVKQGEKIGTMGDTGKSGGEHLHITFSKPTDLVNKFSYNWVINNTIDPYEHILFRLKGINYKFNDKPHYTGSADDGEGSVDLKKIVEFVNVEPKEDKTKDQIYIKQGTLNMRSGAGTSYTALGYAPVGYYDILDTKNDGNYDWICIADGVWVAKVDYVEYVLKQSEPEIDYKLLYEKDHKLLIGLTETLGEVVEKLKENIK